MKTAIVILLLCASSLLAGDRYITFINASSFPRVVSSVNGPAISLEPSATCYVPEEIFLESPNVISFFTESSDPGCSYYGESRPMFMLDSSLVVWPIGQWDSERFSLGFSLGIPVAGFMFLLWIMQLLRKPVQES